MTEIPDILNRILERKAEEVAKRKQKNSVSMLQEIISSMETPRGFAQSLQAKTATRQPAVIAEIKKASPSKGVIRENFKPVEIATDYAMNGASCLSILTDKDFFQGSEAYLQMAKQACPLPVLRKDFMIDLYQITESRAIGADCILLIVAALSDQQLDELSAAAIEQGMDVLVEVHDEHEMERALHLNTPLLGVNNRNLRTFETSLNTTLQLKAMVPEDKLLITESGIHVQEDVQLMMDNDIFGFLIGESFMRASSPGIKLRELFQI